MRRSEATDPSPALPVNGEGEEVPPFTGGLRGVDIHASKNYQRVMIPADTPRPTGNSS